MFALSRHARAASSALVGIALASTLILSACSSSGSSESGDASSAAVESAIVVEDPVVRATDDMSPVSKESGKLMTGSFMALTNNGSSEVALVGGSSPKAGYVEIHEVIDGEMVPMSGGLTLPAGERVKLKMGGYHVMLMDLEGPLAAGEEVPITLEFSDGSTTDIVASSRAIAMDDEQYGPDSE